MIKIKVMVKRFCHPILNDNKLCLSSVRYRVGTIVTILGNFSTGWLMLTTNILPNQGPVILTPKALPTFTYRIGEIINLSPPIRVLPLLSREGEI